MDGRVAVPLRCDDCGEIIYQDQPWDEYGGDYDCSDKPWHTACWEAHLEKKRVDAARDREYIASLKSRPRESLTYSEAATLAMYEAGNHLIDFITKDAEYFGPGEGA